MEPNDNASVINALAVIWDDVDPAFLEAALLNQPYFADKAAVDDPLETIVRNRVMAQITAPSATAMHESPAKLRFSDRILHWYSSPHVRMTAAAIVIITIVWILSSPLLMPKSGSTTAATTRAGSTAAATQAATTAAAGSTAATTLATTAAATRIPTGNGQPGQIVWPMHLPQYLGFDLGRVQSVVVRRFRDNGSVEHSATLSDRESLNRIADLVNQIHLDKPIQQDPIPIATVRYELVFSLDPLPGQQLPKEQSLQLIVVKDTGELRIAGSFADALQIKAQNGLLMANPYLNFDDIATRLDDLIG